MTASENSKEVEPAKPAPSEANWQRYVAPMLLFMALTSAEGFFPAHYYPIIYTVKCVVVTIALYICRRSFTGLKPGLASAAGGVLIGLLVLGEWILIDRKFPELRYGPARMGFNPFDNHSSSFPYLFLTIRFYGLALMVPVMEEIFWRSFLLRFVTLPQFETLAVGSFSITSLLIVSGVFATSHPEWLSALLCALAYGWLLGRTKSLLAVIVAHSVTNLGLGIYILCFHQWHLW